MKRVRLKFKKIFLVLTLLVAIFCVIAILCLRNYDSYPERGCIAHAGGAIDGYKYTNSLEAVENAIAKGYKFIELDLAFTSDSVLVAVHNWAEFRKMCEVDSIEAPLKYEDFISTKIHGKYHPLSANMIDSIFAVHPQTVLVTDKIDDADIIIYWFPSLKGRILAECFSDEAYSKAKKAGIYPMRSRYVNYSKTIAPGCPYVLSKRNYETLRPTKLYKLETCLLNGRMNIFIIGEPSDSSIADSLMAADSYIDHVYIDNL